MAHTPAPWTATHQTVVQRPVRISRHFAIRPQAGPTLAFLPDERIDIAEANAQLIAAAPELLEALKFCKSVIEANGMWELSEQMAVNHAVAAIAKATGKVVEAC
jgi:hypothetical protein